MFGRIMPALAGWLALCAGSSAAAEPLLETSELLASSQEAAAQLPPTYEFTLAQAGDYTLTLEDISSNLGAQARLESLEVLITRELQTVAKFKVDYPAQSDGTTPRATRNFAGTPGIYRVHVLGKVPTDGAGAFSIQVAPTTGGDAVLSQIGSIGANGGPASNQSQLQATFTAPTAGTYELILTDRGFPAPLARVQVVVLRRTGGIPEEVLRSDVNRPVSFTANFAATVPNEVFDLIVIGTANVGQAGLYAVRVESPSDASIYGSENIVGQLRRGNTIDIPANDTYTLTLADLAFPEPLSSMSAAVVQNGVVKGTIANSGSLAVALTPGEAELYVFNATPSVGAMSTKLVRGTQVVHADVHLVDASPDPTTPGIYSFTPSQSVNAGNYTLTVSDFRFPSALASVNTAVVQQAAIVHSTDDLGAETVALQSGLVRVLVAVTPPPAVGGTPGNGMFGLTLTSGDTNIFDGTQGVGGLFHTRPLPVPATGRYDVTLKDFEFPERLRTSWLVITRGTTEIGQVIGSSTIQVQLEAGTYMLNFLGQPAANASYGAYGMRVAEPTPAPVVTLSASPAAVAPGQSTMLTWSATNATSCTASGAWSGTKEASGTASSGPLNANATFEIQCVGPGGRGDASAAVTVNVPASKSGGGGGQLDLLLVIAMVSMAGARVVRRRA